MSINSILIASGAMAAYTKGLSNISDNISNLNTTAYKGKRLSFYEQPGRDDANTFDNGASHAGVTTGVVYRQYNQGDIQQTGSTYDLAVQGDGYFLVQGQRDVEYTRAGSFTLNKDRILVQQGSGKPLLAYDMNGDLKPIVFDASLNVQSGKASTVLEFANVLNSNATVYDMPEAVSIYTAEGDATSVKLSLAADPLVEGQWTVTIKSAEGASQTYGTGTIRFLSNGSVDPAQSKFSFEFKPTGKPNQSVNLDFSKVLRLSTLNSTISLDHQDGLAAGQVSAVKIGPDGKFALSYSNGNTLDLATIALARVDQPDLLNVLEYGVFSAENTGARVEVSKAGTAGLGQLEQGALEASNVDLTKQFSSLIVTQRGYQAASQVISATNEMLGLLFDIRGKR